MLQAYALVRLQHLMLHKRRAKLEEGNVVRTNALKSLLAGAVVVGGAVSMCLGQEGNSDNYDHGVMFVTAGQGGAIALPRHYAVPARLHALTGERIETPQTQAQWQRQVGPTYRVGQAEITLPGSR